MNICLGIALELLVSLCHLTLDMKPAPKPMERMGKQCVCERLYSLVNRKDTPKPTENCHFVHTVGWEARKTSS